MFESVLVANRGEISVRITRTLHRLGIRSVAVFSDADADALHVQVADQAVRLGPAPSRDSYLRIDRIVAAALDCGAQAVHPGYGFLAENADFAAACAAAGLVFIGPPVHAITVMGDKITAKRTVVAAGVPVVPGSEGPDFAAAADEIGYPVLIKPSAGGGGKGMHLVHSPGDLTEALEAARREAASAFGDDTLFLERFVTRPRHIEVQVLADTHGRVVHLGERECSLQRRHQKIIEEAPSPLLDAATRARIGAAAVETARSVGYVGAGTVEFIVGADQPGTFFFMEMNTRLQVEHPVTELVTGLDLVEAQVRIAAGEPLGLTQDDVSLTGHAVEARVCAEDPARGFLPTGGPILLWSQPADARVDSGVATGSVVGSHYDPMLAKVIAHGPDRRTALAALDRALAGMTVLGLTTNIGFLRGLIALPEVRSGALDTGLVERSLDMLTSSPVPEAALLAAANVLLPRGAGPWERRDGWRHGGTASPVRLDLDVDGNRHTLDGRAAAITSAGWTTRRDGDTVWVGRGGSAWGIRSHVPARTARAAAGGGGLYSPMPGTVLAVTEDGPVTAGQTVVVVEAMKMEHPLRAPFDGTAVTHVKVGDQVAVDHLLAVVTGPGAVPSPGS